MGLLKTEMDFFFSKKIEKKEEELFIMRYNVLSKKITGLTESFTINVKRLKELLIINHSKPYCKFYLLEENNSLNIGLSFSDKDEDDLLAASDDILYVLNNDFFIEIDLDNFNSLVNVFNEGIGKKLKQHTKFTTTLISYNYDTVYTYISALEFHFNSNQLKFNMLQFRGTDLNNTTIRCSQGREDRISFCVHAIINTLDNKSTAAESDGYDLGNLRP